MAIYNWTLSNKNMINRNENFSRKFFLFFVLTMSTIVMIAADTIPPEETRHVDPSTGGSAFRGRPDFFKHYEKSSFGEGAWAVSSLISAPVVILVVSPVCVGYDYLFEHQEARYLSSQWRPDYLVRPYWYNQKVRFVSDEFLIKPIYLILSIPLIPVKYIYDFFI